MMSRCRVVAFVTGNLPHSKAAQVGDAVLDALGRLGVRPMFPSQVCCVDSPHPGTALILLACHRRHEAEGLPLGLHQP